MFVYIKGSTKMMISTFPSKYTVQESYFEGA